MAPTGTLAVGGTSWSKWQIALVVGAPVALGLGYWYLKRQPTREKPSQDDDKKSKTKGTSAAMLHEPSLDTTDSATGTGSAGGDVVYLTPQKRAQEFKNTGNKSFKLGNYQDAIDNYTKAIEICPKENANDLSTFYQNRAAAYEQMKDYEKAKDDCTSALALNPSYVKALHRRSKAYEFLGILELSLEDITAACILENFQSESTLLMADRVLKALGRKHAKEAMLTRKPVMPSKHFIKTYFLSFYEDPVTKVISANGDAKKENGTETLTGYARACQAMVEQNYEEVLSACTAEIENEGSQKPEAQLLRATLRLLRGEHKTAMADFEAVIDNEKADVKVRVNALIKRASLYMQLEQPILSLQDFNKAAELDPVNSDVYHHRGQVKLLLEDLGQAMEDFEKAVTLNPDFPIAFVQKCYTDFRFAHSMRDMNKVQEVTQRFEEAMRRFPKCTEAFTLYAQVLTEQEDYSRADELYAKASSVEPNNATVLVHRAILHLHWTQDVAKAVQLINDALRIDDKCEFAYETLGTIEVQRANLLRAIELFNKAIPLAKTELEMSHLFALKDAAVAQDIVAKRLGIAMPVPPQLA